MAGKLDGFSDRQARSLQTIVGALERAIEELRAPDRVLDRRGSTAPIRPRPGDVVRAQANDTVVLPSPRSAKGRDPVTILVEGQPVRVLAEVSTVNDAAEVVVTSLGAQSWYSTGTEWWGSAVGGSSGGGDPTVLTLQENGVDLGTIDTLNVIGLDVSLSTSTGTISGLFSQTAVSISSSQDPLSITGVSNRDTLAVTITADATVLGIDATGISAGFEFTLTLGTAAGFQLTFRDSAASTATNSIETPDHMPLILREDGNVTFRRTATRWTVIDPDHSHVERQRVHLERAYDFTYVGSPGTVTAGTDVDITTEAGSWAARTVTANGTVTAVNGEADAPGIIQMTTGASNGASVTLYQAVRGTSTVLPLRANQVRTFTVRTRLTNTSNVAFRFGYASDPIGASTATSAAMWIYDTNVDTSLRAITRASGSAETTVLSTPGTSFVRYDIVQVAAGTFLFFRDRTLVATHSSTVPGAVSVAPFFQIITRTAGSKTLETDFVAYDTKALTR